MNENIKKFLEKVEADQELQAKLSQIRDPEEAYKLAASLQSGFTQDEFVTEMKKIYVEATKDLSEDDIAKVAGGADTSLIVVSVTVGVSGLSASLAAGAAAA